MAGTGDRGGVITLKANGVVYDAKGNFTYNLGRKKRTMIAGADRVHGPVTAVQVPYIEGALTDDGDLNVAALMDVTEATLTLDLASGKQIILRRACYAGEGNITTEQGEIACRWEGREAIEVMA